MLTGQAAALRAAALAPDARAYVLKSRNVGETGYTSYAYTGMEQPADQDELLLAGAVVGERWKVVELFAYGQAVVPKELDQFSDGVSLYTIKSFTAQFDRNIYRCRGLYVGPG